MQYYNKQLLECMSAIDSRFTDVSVYAQSMHDYVQSKCDLFNMSVNDIMIASQSVGKDHLPFSPKRVITQVIVNVSGFQPGSEEFQVIWNEAVVTSDTDGADGKLKPRPFIEDGMGQNELNDVFSTDDIPAEVLDAVEAHIGDSFPLSDTVCDWVDTYRQATYYAAGLISEDDPAIVTVGSSVYKSVFQIEDYIGTAATQTQSILAALQTAADQPEDVSQYVTDLIASSSEAANSAFGQQILSIARDCKNNPVDIVNTVVTTVTNSAQSAIDSIAEKSELGETDGTFNADYTIGSVTTASSSSLFWTEVGKGFKSIGSGFVKVCSLAWSTVKAVFSLGIQLVKSIAKPLFDVFKNPLMEVNKNAPKNNNCLDFPLFSVSGSTYQLANGSKQHALWYNQESWAQTDIVKNILGGASFNLSDCLRKLLSDTRLFKMDYHFGSCYFGRVGSRSIPIGDFDGQPAINAREFYAKFDSNTGVVTGSYPINAFKYSVESRGHVDVWSDLTDVTGVFGLPMPEHIGSTTVETPPYSMSAFNPHTRQKIDVPEVVRDIFTPSKSNVVYWVLGQSYNLDVIANSNTFESDLWRVSIDGAPGETLDHWHKGGPFLTEYSVDMDMSAYVHLQYNNKDATTYEIVNPRWDEIIDIDGQTYILFDYIVDGDNFYATYVELLGYQWSVMDSLYVNALYPLLPQKVIIDWPGDSPNATLMDMINYMLASAGLPVIDDEVFLSACTRYALAVDPAWDGTISTYKDFHNFLADHGAAITTLDFRVDIFISPTLPLRGDYAYDDNVQSLISYTQRNDSFENHVTLRDELNSLFPEDTDIRLIISDEDISSDDYNKILMSGLHASVYRLFVMTILRASCFTLQHCPDDYNILDAPWKTVNGDDMRPAFGYWEGTSDPTRLQLVIPHLTFSSTDYCIVCDWYNVNHGQDVSLSIPISNNNWHDWCRYVFDTTTSHEPEFNVGTGYQFVSTFSPTPGTVHCNFDDYMFGSQILMDIIAFMCSVHMPLIASNQPDLLSKLYKLRGEFPSFVPYVRQMSVDAGRYHVRSDEEIRRKAAVLAMALASAITVVTVVVGVIAARFFIKRGLRKVAEKLANSTESNKYVYQDIVAAYRAGGSYKFISAGEYNSLQKWVYDWAVFFNEEYSSKLVSDDLMDRISRCYEDDESIVITADEEVEPIVDKEIYDKASNLYVGALRRDRLKTSIISKIGGNAYSYNVYDDLLFETDEGSASVEDVVANTENIKAKADLSPVVKLITGNTMDNKKS